MGTAQGGGSKGKGAKVLYTRSAGGTAVTVDASPTPAAATGGEKSWVQVIDELRSQVRLASDGEVQARSRLESVLDRVERVLFQAGQVRASLIAMSLEAAGETTRMALSANVDRLERAALECQQLLQGCGREVKRPVQPGVVERAYELRV